QRNDVSDLAVDAGRHIQPYDWMLVTLDIADERRTGREDAPQIVLVHRSDRPRRTEGSMQIENFFASLRVDQHDRFPQRIGREQSLHAPIELAPVPGLEIDRA